MMSSSASSVSTESSIVSGYLGNVEDSRELRLASVDERNPENKIPSIRPPMKGKIIEGRDSSAL